MTTFNFFCRTLAVSALTALGAGAAQADASWDIVACSGGTKLAAGYTGCGGVGASGVTMNVTAYTSTGSTFSAASINDGGSYTGVWSGSENSGTSSSTNSPNHAIDNYTSYGNAYEMVLLSFSKAVDISQLVATWANNTGGDADFQVYRWTAAAGPAMTSLSPSSMSSWVLASAAGQDFKTGGLTQTISDGTYYSSYWLVSTAFGGSNDAFKLGTVYATGVCTNSTAPGTSCSPSQSGSVPEPVSLALFGVAVLGARVARRRQASPQA